MNNPTALHGRRDFLAEALTIVVITLCLANTCGSAFASDDLARFRATYKMLVETNTTYSSGNCTLAATRLAEVLKDAGFPAGDVHVVVPDGHPKEGSLTAVLHGTNPKTKGVLLLGHIDTVEAKREDWGRDPFKLIEQNGYFYARGASDDKAMSSINVDIMARLREERFKPRDDIKLAATCGEETFGTFPGAVDGFEYLLRRHRDLVDARLALNEGAGGRMDDNGKHLALEIQAGEKLYQDFKLTITGPGGHSSRPLPNDVIHQMASAIDKIDSFRFPIRLLPVVRGTFEAMSKQATGPLGKALEAAANPDPDPAALEILSRDPSYASMMRTTCVATMVTAGHAPNALAQRAEINVNCRILPGDKPDEILARLKQAVANSNVVFTWATPPGPVPNVPTLTPELMALVQKNADAVWPGIPLVPVISVGWTDGSLGNAAGLPTYGLSGIFHAPGGDGVHGLNERISEKSLYDARTFLYRVVKDLTN